MSLAASGQLIDRDPAVFLPGAVGRHRRLAGGISRPRIANLTPAPNQTIQVGEVSFDLRSLILIHGDQLCLLLRANVRQSSRTNDAHSLRTRESLDSTQRGC